MPLAQARANPVKIDWTGYQVPAPEFSRHEGDRRLGLAEIARYIDWTPFFQTWEMKGVPIPRSSMTKNRARRRGRCLQMRRPCSTDHRGAFVRPPGRRWASGPPTHRGRRHPPLHRRGPRDGAERRFTPCRQQHGQASGRPNVALADFVGAGRCRRLHRWLRRDRRARRGRDRPIVSTGRTTTIQRSS